MKDMYDIYRDDDGDLCLGVEDLFGYTQNPLFWTTIYEGFRLDYVLKDSSRGDEVIHMLPLEFFD